MSRMMVMKMTRYSGCRDRMDGGSSADGGGGETGCCDV
jgi:hypothetical protein